MDSKKTIDYKCNICNKFYKTYQTLWKHNKKFHSDKNITLPSNTIMETSSNNHNNHNALICKYCNKMFSHRNNRWRHEKKCKINNESNKEINKELEIEKIKLDQINSEKDKIKEEKDKIKLQNESLRLKIKLQNCKKLNDKTFKAVNKYLMDRSFRNNNINSNNNNNNTNNNNITNNFQIFSLGNENLVEKLTMYEKKQIMNFRLCSIEKIVEIAHCGNYTQFKNIVITNLKDNFAYKYNEEKGYFVTVTKTDVLTDLIGDRIMDIEAIYNELSSANKIDEKTKTLIQRFLDKIQCDDVTYYDEDIKYDNFKSYKINSIKILLYNNHDKITKDIALLFTNENNEALKINN